MSDTKNESEQRDGEESLLRSLFLVPNPSKLWLSRRILDATRRQDHGDDDASRR